MDNIFKYALQNKFRFPFKGQISTEDLFDLKLTDLDAIFKVLTQDKDAKKESLLNATSKADTDLALKIEIVKEIFTDKKKAAEAQQKAVETKIRNQKILDIIARKEAADLEAKSIDELKAMLSDTEN